MQLCFAKEIITTQFKATILITLAAFWVGHFRCRWVH